MHECPKELRKSALFILNANGASLLLAGSFGGQGSSKQKGTVETGPCWKQDDKEGRVRGWWGGRREDPCTSRRYLRGWATSRIGTVRRPGGGTFRRVPEQLRGERLCVLPPRNFGAEKRSSTSLKEGS